MMTARQRSEIVLRGTKGRSQARKTAASLQSPSPVFQKEPWLVTVRVGRPRQANTE